MIGPALYLPELWLCVDHMGRDASIFLIASFCPADQFTTGIES